MPFLVSPPLIGGTNRAVSGRITVTPTHEYTWGEHPVVRVPQQGIVADGEFYRVPGIPLFLVPTPEGVGMRLSLTLDSKTGPVSFSRVVQVPDTGSVLWDDLADMLPKGS